MNLVDDVEGNVDDDVKHTMFVHELRVHDGGCGGWDF